MPNTPCLRLWLLDELFPEQALELEIVNRRGASGLVTSKASGVAGAEYLMKYPQWVKGRCVVDVGPGSGVVAIAAAMAGARKVIACDLDADALTATRVNALENDVEVMLSQDLDSALPRRIW